MNIDTPRAYFTISYVDAFPEIEPYPTQLVLAGTHVQISAIAPGSQDEIRRSRLYSGPLEWLIESDFVRDSTTGPISLPTDLQRMIQLTAIVFRDHTTISDPSMNIVIPIAAHQPLNRNRYYTIQVQRAPDGSFHANIIDQEKFKPTNMTFIASLVFGVFLALRSAH